MKKSFGERQKLNKVMDNGKQRKICLTRFLFNSFSNFIRRGGDTRVMLI